MSRTSGTRDSPRNGWRSRDADEGRQASTRLAARPDGTDQRAAGRSEDGIRAKASQEIIPLVEGETDDGRGISIGHRHERPDGNWSLRIDGVLIPPKPCDNRSDKVGDEGSEG
jgi:hypothetical protein